MSFESLVKPGFAAEVSKQVQSSLGFPHFCIDGFLDTAFAEEVEQSYPSFEDAATKGRVFSAHHENRKVQVTDTSLFPEPVSRLNALFGSPEMVKVLSEVTDIGGLLYDMNLVGGGMHMTNGGGRLDVHVDFDFIKEKNWSRRLNLLLYLNRDWKEEYGGYLDLWDENVKHRIGYFEPKFNRLCGFVTSDISFHGVTPLSCPAGVVRKSFATYYYTKASKEEIASEHHTTIFVSRPNETIRQLVDKPAYEAMSFVKRQLARVKRKLSP